MDLHQTVVILSV